MRKTRLQLSEMPRSAALGELSTWSRLELHELLIEICSAAPTYKMDRTTMIGHIICNTHRKDYQRKKPVLEPVPANVIQFRFE